MPHATLVRRVVVDEGPDVASEGNGIGLQSGPQHTLGTRQVGGGFGLQEAVLCCCFKCVGGRERKVSL